jgi:hypothetical protein
MKDPVYRFSAATVSFARLLEAGFDLGFSLGLILMALWLTLSFGLNWLIIGLDIFLVLCAAQAFVMACTIYSTSRLPERPDERERYLQSRSLYMPANQREAHRERKP